MPQHDVFISYSHRAAGGFVKQYVIPQLKQNGITVWWDNEIPPTSNDWRDTVTDAIDRCNIIIVVMDREAAQSQYVAFEWAYAMGQGMPIFLLQHEKVDEQEMPGLIRTHQRLRFDGGSGHDWEGLCEQIKKVNETISATKQDPEEECSRLIEGYQSNLLNLLEDFLTTDILTVSDLTSFTLYGLISYEQKTKLLDKHTQFTPDELSSTLNPTNSETEAVSESTFPTDKNNSLSEKTSKLENDVSSEDDA